VLFVIYIKLEMLESFGINVTFWLEFV
jgi:hypothetical protein